jgi:HK97 family phage major capsid protein
MQAARWGNGSPLIDGDHVNKTRFLSAFALVAIALLFTFDASAATTLHHLLSPEVAGTIMAAPVLAGTTEGIQAELKRIADEAGTRVDELQANLQHTQQVLAKIEANGGGGYSDVSVIGIGIQAKEQLAKDQVFNEAAETVGRGMSPGKFSARVNLETGIRAALTTEGSGQADDTYVPSSPERRAGFITGPLRPLRILDVLPSRPVGKDSVEFIQLNSTGDAAEQIKEGDEKAEVDFNGTLQRASIVTIAAHTTASTQILSDQSALAQQIDTLLRYKVLARLEDQIVHGTGGQGRINGLLNQATLFTPEIGESPAEVIGEAMVEMSGEGYLPNLVLMNNVDWFRLQLVKDADGNYLFGSPTSPLAPSLWNGRIVTTPTITQGSAMVLDTSFVNVLDRWQTRVSVATEHKDYFTRNLVAILGELRAGLEVLDSKAIRKFALEPVTS